MAAWAAGAIAPDASVATMNAISILRNRRALTFNVRV